MTSRGKSKISVIMPTFKDAKYLRLAVESLLAQNVKPYEIIIIDDCPDDKETEKMLRQEFAPEIKLGKIRYFKNPKNLGASGSRNHGVGLARGDLIVFCDSDDIFLPQHLETFLRVKAKTNADIVSCHTKFYIDENGKSLSERKKSWRGNLEYKIFILGITGADMMITPKVFADLGGFDTKIAASHDKPMFAEDWDLLVRAFHKGYKIAFDDSGTYLHREHANSLTGKFFDWTKYRREVIFPRISTNPDFTRKQLAIFSFGTLVSAPIKQMPPLIAQTLKLSPAFFLVQPAWTQLAAKSLSNRFKRRTRRAKTAKTKSE